MDHYEEARHAYEEALKYPECQKLYVTQVHKSFNCDVFFPEFKSRFVKTQESTHHNEGPLIYHFEEYELKFRSIPIKSNNKTHSQ
jgi:dihydrofolate reductase